ncbi:(d)CMP kinase [Gilvimarinus sp. DA14]|uniref:(d)CMP kinase n=1 Tax=Gilvimarinus sp. DA14 TaxID=2956798 RepID=UPI0020B674EA|nr:(d)CMP kinase [Gilvimarinus sp. DA14]UTF60755.1 (d)CMP kinase [Gilvimarinus sp. DA14]
MKKNFVITIDGPSGAGKGTLSQLLAQKLGASLLDSGALYRLVALHSLKTGIASDDIQSLSESARVLPVRFVQVDGRSVILLDNEDVTLAIREEKVGMLASKVAAIPEVREALLERQRQFALDGPLVADGRDMGTTVFPQADCKFFLTASAEARAQRRYKQLQGLGENVDLTRLVADIQIRDEQDRNRASSPLRPAEDAISIDSTALSIDEVLAVMMAHIDQG